MQHESLLVPFGVLEVSRGTTQINQLNLRFGRSRETADFLVDAMELGWWWRRAEHVGVTRLMIELDNGPELSSARTQFLKRLIEFAHRTGLTIELVDSPPSHSKYNPIERCEGILESHWNGTLLGTIETALQWAGTMTWRGLHPIVRELTATDERGVKVTKATFAALIPGITRDPSLPPWSVVITPANRSSILNQLPEAVQTIRLFTGCILQNTVKTCSNRSSRLPTRRS